MSDDENTTVYKKEKKTIHNNGMAGGIYGMAFIGAAIYFIQHAATFWMVLLGILKAIIWPVLLIYNLLDFLKM
jgi:hypothetical protein